MVLKFVHFEGANLPVFASTCAVVNHALTFAYHLPIALSLRKLLKPFHAKSRGFAIIVLMGPKKPSKNPVINPAIAAIIPIGLVRSRDLSVASLPSSLSFFFLLASSNASFSSLHRATSKLN